MADTTLKSVIEAALLAAGQPITIERLLGLFPDEEQPDRNDLCQAIEALKEDYAGRGIELQEVASGFRIQVRQAMEPWVSRLWEEKPPKYSRALLETLALIAYRQPITRGEIEDIRGVAVSTSIMKTLQERDWVRVVGHRDVPGRPAMYGTTKEFLDYFNLKRLDDLPSLAELRDLDTINAELDLGPPGGEVQTGDRGESAAVGELEAEPDKGADLDEASDYVADVDFDTSETAEQRLH
jgi:segregation and condensation protein B